MDITKSKMTIHMIPSKLYIQKLHYTLAWNKFKVAAGGFLVMHAFGVHLMHGSRARVKVRTIFCVLSSSRRLCYLVYFTVCSRYPKSKCECYITVILRLPL